MNKNQTTMKAKIAILFLSVIALLSFTAVSTNKTGLSAKDTQHKSYQFSGGQAMVDKGQFN